MKWMFLSSRSPGTLLVSLLAVSLSIGCVSPGFLKKTADFFMYLGSLKWLKNSIVRVFEKIPVKMPPKSGIWFFKIVYPSLNGCSFVCISIAEYVQMLDGINRLFCLARMKACTRFQWILIASFCTSFKQLYLRILSSAIVIGGSSSVFACR